MHPTSITSLSLSHYYSPWKAMKFEEIALGFWEQNSSCSSSSSSTSSLTISFKRLRPLAPKLIDETTEAINSFDLRGTFKQASQSSSDAKCSTHIPVVPHAGGTRWNPTQEQIRRLEALYRGGLRTPNAHQIERITAELGKYGRIEGKNVFYWFQNHKARERQKQKRSALVALSHSSQLISFATDTKDDINKENYDGSCKRQCRSWEAGLDVEEGVNDGTLELFPLHPEWGR